MNKKNLKRKVTSNLSPREIIKFLSGEEKRATIEERSVRSAKNICDAIDKVGSKLTKKVETKSH